MVKIWERPAPTPDPEEPTPVPVEALEPVEEAQETPVEQEDSEEGERRWLYWQG